jgi:hypothetical protein
MNREEAALKGNSLDPGLPLLGRAHIAILGMLAVVAILSWLLLAFIHVHDRYNVNAVSGSLLALSERAREGVLYPPLFDGQSYGGTRTMPLPILLYAGAISLGGELLAPAKIVDFLASAALVLVLVAVLIRLGATAILSLALASTVIATQVFLLAGTGIRPESLPTALQLGAVALVAFSSRRALIVLAAALCAVAIFCKLSALWAPIAIAVWLLARERRKLLLFAMVFAAGTVALLVTFDIASDGRILTNLLELGGAGLSLVGGLKSPLKAIELLLQYAQSSFALLPFVLLGLVFATRHSRPTIFQIGLVAATGIALVVLADVGSDYNHLLDFVVLMPIAAFEVAKSLATRLVEPRLVWSFMAVTVLVGSSAALAANAGPSLAASLQLPTTSPGAAYDPRPLVAELSSARTVLSEDPYVPLSRGERPFVMDAFMLLRIARRDPRLVEPLITRIEGGQFDAIVLGEDLQLPDTISWFRDLAFGLPAYQAIRTDYHFCSATGGYFVYFANSLPCPNPGK